MIKKISDAREWLRAEINRLAESQREQAAADLRPPPPPKTPPPEPEAEAPKFVTLPRLPGETNLAYAVRSSVPPCTLPLSAFGDPERHARAMERFARSLTNQPQPKPKPSPHGMTTFLATFRKRW